MSIPSVNVSQIYKNNPDIKKSDVKALQEWTSKQPHLPNISELQVMAFLKSCYCSTEQAKTTIDNFFTVKTMCPDIFGGTDPKSPSVQAALGCTLITPLSKPTQENCKIFWFKFIDCIPNHFDFPNQIRYFHMAEMLVLQKEGPQEGLVLVFDMDGCVFGHLARLSIVVMKKLLFYLQDAMPLRLKAIHFANAVPFIDKLLALMRPFIKKEMIEMIYIHDSIETLFKHVPKECLPREYGGQDEPLNVLHENIKKEFIENADFFAYEESQTINENKRPGKPKTLADFFGIDGTFKKLEVD